uniref:Uncharacterized protein n=1 Tax=Candidatus Kentrum sp. TUN TaxID=2126343 RepID=A0A450ZNJ1_9GAMM|nr:MAG: hypothetical protein BECKTUN1418F_GA0071002_10669 [Candidatus Kentron sp. TUN]VFK55422.1 MAG: hypothetical protein BECKTUN1418E_GA0071001_102914 [Candidatus Kentron sp. TUN]
MGYYWESGGVGAGQTDQYRSRNGFDKIRCPAPRGEFGRPDRCGPGNRDYPFRPTRRHTVRLPRGAAVNKTGEGEQSNFVLTVLRGKHRMNLQQIEHEALHHLSRIGLRGIRKPGIAHELP